MAADFIWAVRLEKDHNQQAAVLGGPDFTHRKASSENCEVFLQCGKRCQLISQRDWESSKLEV